MKTAINAKSNKKSTVKGSTAENCVCDPKVAKSDQPVCCTTDGKVNGSDKTVKGSAAVKGAAVQAINSTEVAGSVKRQNTSRKVNGSTTTRKRKRITRKKKSTTIAGIDFGNTNQLALIAGGGVLLYLFSNGVNSQQTIYPSSEYKRA